MKLFKEHLFLAFAAFVFLFIFILIANSVLFVGLMM